MTTRHERARSAVHAPRRPGRPRVTPSVSVPEKTLEHWASQYLTYRYRSLAALWWPTRGEDIDVRLLPAAPGKAVQIELKTTTVAGTGLHDVLIDLGQLWEYRHRRPARQPFYAFPWPDWPGDLSTAATSGGRSVTELAFARSGSHWWFANWMVVLTAADVAAVLHPELTAHGSAKRGTKQRLVRFDLTSSTSSPTVTWGSSGSGAPAPPVLGWREFWTTLEGCGHPDWPQLILLPTSLIDRTAGRLPHAQVLELIREARMTAGQQRRGDVTVLELSPDGDYAIVTPADDPGDPDDRPREPQGDTDPTDDQTPDYRQVVYLNTERGIAAATTPNAHRPDARSTYPGRQETVGDHASTT